MEEKACTRCGQSFPATAEYFYRSQQGKHGLAAACKACSNKQVMDWRARNRERFNANNRAYSKRLTQEKRNYYYQHRHEPDYRARQQAKSRRYYTTHRAQVLSRVRHYRHTHRETINATLRRYRQRHLEQMRAYSRAYYQTKRKDNPDFQARNRANSRRYYWQRRNNPAYMDKLRRYLRDYQRKRNRKDKETA